MTPGGPEAQDGPTLLTWLPAGSSTITVLRHAMVLKSWELMSVGNPRRMLESLATWTNWPYVFLVVRSLSSRRREMQSSLGAQVGPVVPLSHPCMKWVTTGRSTFAPGSIATL